jgi:hypothetical protein
MSRNSFVLPEVPLNRISVAGHCLVACAYMVLKYWFNKEQISGNFPSFEEFTPLFGRTIKNTGFPPNKLRDYIRKMDIFRDVRVQHRKGKSLRTLEFRIRQGVPPIVLFDNGYYHQLIESMARHATVLVGYTPENLRANDPFGGEQYPYERKRFMDSWQKKEGRYILITPKIHLKRWLS